LPVERNSAGLMRLRRLASSEPIEADPIVADPDVALPGIDGKRTDVGISGVVDAATLGEALEREGPILLAAARAIVFDDAEAHDLVQATFEIAIRRIDDLREPAALRAWLLAIQAREAFRARRRIRRILRLDSSLSEIPSSATMSADVLAVREALRRLSPRVRAVVVLHHLIGLSVDEVANALGTSPNTVKSQLQTGLARLRRELDDD
jgi:RNA polymerase sigma-70 factor (ECF subfamily)